VPAKGPWSLVDAFDGPAEAAVFEHADMLTRLHLWSLRVQMTDPWSSDRTYLNAVAK
jgi:hypothetical protein